MALPNYKIKTEELLNETKYTIDQLADLKNPFKGVGIILVNLYAIALRHERELAEMRK